MTTEQVIEKVQTLKLAIADAHVRAAGSNDSNYAMQQLAKVDEWYTVLQHLNEVYPEAYIEAMVKP